MNKELATIFKNKLVDVLPFADLVAGLAQTVTTQDSSDETGTTIVKRFPVAYDTNAQADCFGVEISLIPDSARKSIIYFEDFGLASLGRLGALTGFKSSLRLICWLNRAQLVGDHYAEISGRCMAAIIETLAEKAPENIEMFTRLRVKVERIPPQDAGLFGRYTYNETDRQYLRPPFEFFGIDLSSEFYISPKCLETIEWNKTTC